ncbi:MAG: helix-turn-helix transcriptional regulator [Anaerolineae bacterium]|nr:helix-turn-helix transcriptional regulator [Anaerolineae bacterium]
MSVKHALLGILARSPGHGYELKRAFEEKLGEFWPLNFGQIYTTLDRLEADGLVAHDPVAQHDKPDKKVYHITEAGIAEFNQWRTDEFKVEPRVLRDELFLRLAFMDADEIDAVLVTMQRQQNVYLSQMMQLTDRKYQIEQQAKKALQKTTISSERREIEHNKMIQMALIDAALFHAEADIRWLRQCEARLKDINNGQEHS